MGWESQEIEGGCEVIVEICDDSGEDPMDLSPRQIEDSIGDELTPEERRAFQLLASVSAADDDETRELKEELWELE